MPKSGLFLQFYGQVKYFMSDKHPFWNKLTKALRDPAMDRELQSASLQESFFKDSEFSFKERLSISNSLLHCFPVWVKDYFSGLENFSETNITNGNTDALNLVLLNSKYSQICTLPDEYMYYTHLAKSLKIKQQYFTENCFDLIDKDAIVCLSVPASHNGEIESKQAIINYCQENNIALFIDVAYCGLTAPGMIHIRKSEKTFFAFSFSKTLGLAFNRVGLLYSNQTIISLSLMNKIGYINLSGAASALRLMKKFPCNYIYEQYKDQYSNICREQNLKETHCILYGHTESGEKFGIAEQYKLHQ